MSLGQQAARGALWTIVSSIGGRAVGVVGTLVMTRFLEPNVMGEISVALILVLTATWFSNFGFTQYATVKGRGDDEAEVNWHTLIWFLGLGTVAMGLVVLLGSYLTPFFDAPHAAVYIPGMALAMWLRRFATMPEIALTRAMRFRASGIALGAGEIVYTGSALLLAYLGWGGMAIVLANIVQSVFCTAVMIGAAGWRSWCKPTPYSSARTRDIFSYGVPLAIGGIAHNISRDWDNLAISHFFGPTATGAYSMAYNLADVPAIQVGEQIALVLLPSMSALEPEDRPAALERSSALLSLIIFPLAVGLGAVAYPLIAVILPANAWQEIAPLLTVLASVSVFRPISWVLATYMAVEGKTKQLMVLEVVKVVLLLAGIAVLSRFGVRVAASAVGITFGGQAIIGVMMVTAHGVGGTRPSVARLAIGFLQPLLACGMMVAGVYGTHVLLGALGNDMPLIELVSEIVVGALVYVVSALVIARETSRDLLRLLKRALKKS